VALLVWMLGLSNSERLHWLPFPVWLFQDLVLHLLKLVADVLEIRDCKLLNWAKLFVMSNSGFLFVHYDSKKQKLY